MKVLAPTILLFEALLVALAIPVAITVQGAGAVTIWVLAILSLVLLVASGASRRPQGVAIGWACQVLVILSGLLVPTLAVIGLIFLGVWVVAVIYGGKADRIAAARAASAPSPADPSGDAGPSLPSVEA